MKNGRTHKRSTKKLGDLATLLRAPRVIYEHRVPGFGWVDLLIDTTGGRIAVEVEATSPRRTQHDVDKAVALHADVLLIVAPTRKLADACARQLKGRRTRGLRVHVCTHTQAVHHLARLLGGPHA